MIPAYDEMYLENAQINLGTMLDFAVYDMNFNISDFFDRFIRSGIAKRFGDGDFSLLAGKSGYEIAYDVLWELGELKDLIQPRYVANRSEEYWTGWALAYFQWETGLSFEEIIHYVPICNIQALYYPYHEMDIRQFSDRMRELCRAT